MKHYFSFTETANRTEYWLTHLIVTVTYMVSILSSSLLMMNDGSILPTIGAIMIFMSIGVALWCLLAVSSRRCIDSGTNPWWVVTLMIPIVGAITFICLGLFPTKSQQIDG